MNHATMVKAYCWMHTLCQKWVALKCVDVGECKGGNGMQVSNAQPLDLLGSAPEVAISPLVESGRHIVCSLYISGSQTHSAWELQPH